jgi:pyruvate kinase
MESMMDETIDRSGKQEISNSPLDATAASWRAQAEELIQTLRRIRTAMVEMEARFATAVADLEEARQPSARNMLHYLAFRQFDIRGIQETLAMLGLSSLGRTEAHVLASVDQVLAILYLMAGRVWVPPPAAPAIGFAESQRLLDAHTEALLGPSPLPRTIRIMVTMPTEAATDPTFVHAMLAAGMDCMRINCAHDDAETWAAMVANLRQAERTLGNTCRVLMDLGGPKLRTGPVAGPQIVKCRPERDGYGRIVAPARIWFTASESPAPAPDAAALTIPVPAVWLAQAEFGDQVRFIDTRGARRTITIVAANADGRWGETTRTCYVMSGMEIRLRKPGNNRTGGRSVTTRIGALAGANPAILLKPGDLLQITRSMEPGAPATYDDNGAPVTPATIGCTLPEIFRDVRPGEQIWLDDGKIGGMIRAVTPDHMDVAITHARLKGSRLRADKGINLPDSTLCLPALTERDLQDLTVAVRLADMVGLSFVRDADDVRLLQERLHALDAGHVGIVLKLETRHAFEQLPHLLLAVMRSKRAGVMIARGDLAVESGFERLAEVQEEILWLSEAAHLPAIWATQVLETLANTGLSTRAEITDAAMGVRAECVMLNKGPYIVDAIGTLDDILQRMQGHRRKRVALLRQLRAWSASFAVDEAIPPAAS